MMTQETEKVRTQMQMVCIDDLVTKDHLLRLIDRAIGIEKGAENHMSDEIRIQVLK